MCGRFSGKTFHNRLAVLEMLAAALPFLAGCPSESGESENTEKTDGDADIVITIVYDNNPFDKRLATAWGFGCVAQGPSESILFDTGGNGELLLSNMATCGIKPDEISAVVLSHIHADHTGGLGAFLHANSKVKVFLPKVFPSWLKKEVRESGAVLVETEGPCKICDGVWTTGVLGRAIEEQGMYLKSPRGLIVITGCAHPGVVQMAKAAKEHAGAAVQAVLGGFHMAGAPRRRIHAVIEDLKKLGVRQVAPCHCSGEETRRLMKKAFSDGYLPSGVGARLAFHAECREEP